MAKATFDIKSIEIPAVAAKPLYAGVGATDIAFTAVKEYVSDVQRKLTTFDAKSLRKQAVAAAAARRDKVEATVSDLQADALALPTRVTSTVNENVALATAAYDDLADRGETVVTRIRKSSPSASISIKSTPTKPASVKATATTQPVVKQPARKFPTQKITVKKAAAKKVAAKNTPAKSTPAKATTKSTTAKSTTIKSAAAKSTATKSTAAKNN